MPKVWVGRALSTLSKGEVSRLQRLKDSTESLPRLREALLYSCDTSKLRRDLVPKFVQLSASLRTLDFLRNHPPHSTLQCWLRSVAGIFMSNTNANTFLGMYKMHVLDSQSARQLLGIPLGETLGSLLDVGAGDGNVTTELLPLFKEVLATEVSPWALHRLKEKGIPCQQLGDISTLPTAAYDVVSCLNVLDRCSHPRTLLRELRRRMRPDTGRVLLAVVFPFQPFVESGGLVRTQPPAERLALDPSAGWEASVNQLTQSALEPAGFRVERLTRVPYLCQGDLDTPYYALDDAVFVLAPADAPADAPAAPPAAGPESAPHPPST